jgi:hypothetical protein
MCSGVYNKDPIFAEAHKKARFVRRKAVYFLRGRYRKIGGKNCIYCGFKSDTGDHVPPLLEGYKNGVENGVIVSSCYDCNKYLGSFSSTCLKDRASFLFRFYGNEVTALSGCDVDSNGESEGLDKATAFRLKATRCKERMEASNCNLLKGAAALFKQNGQSGGETASYESLPSPKA